MALTRAVSTEYQGFFFSVFFFFLTFLWLLWVGNCSKRSVTLLGKAVRPSSATNLFLYIAFFTSESICSCAAISYIFFCSSKEHTCRQAFRMAERSQKQVILVSDVPSGSRYAKSHVLATWFLQGRFSCFSALHSQSVGWEY